MLPIRTILHPTDFSDCSRHAGELAVNLAKDYRANVVFLNVLERSAHDSQIAIALADLSVVRFDAERKLTGLHQACTDVACRHMVIEGCPAAEIIRVASEMHADLIVLGTHGRTGLGRLVMGSVAEEVIRRAPCPVLVLNPTVPATVDYEDWISKAMSVPERCSQRGGTAAAPEVVSGAAIT